MPFSFASGSLIDSATLSQFIWGVDDATTDLDSGDLSDAEIFQIELAVNAINAQIKRYCSNDIVATNYVETWDGAGSDELVPRAWPIISVTSVKFSGNGDFASVSALDSSTVFYDTVSIRFRGMRTPSGRGLVQVSYRAGYEDVPSDIQMAALLQFQYLYKKFGRGDNMVGLQSISKSVGSGSESQTKDSSIKPGVGIAAGNSGLISEASGMLSSYCRFEAPQSIMFARVS